MKYDDLKTLPLGTALWYREGKLSMPCFLANTNRDPFGCVIVSGKKALDQRWKVKPRQLTLVTEHAECPFPTTTRELQIWCDTCGRWTDR
jgi:hypothetical protein